MKVMQPTERIKLAKAVENNDLSAVLILLEGIRKIDIQSEKDFEIIGWCAYHGNMDMLKLLVEHGINIHAADSYGDTALLITVREGHLEMTKELVRIGLDVNAKLSRGTYNGYTPLKTAQEKGFIEIVEFLQNHGAKL